MTGRKKTKARSMTLRQRLRADSEQQLDGMVERASEVVAVITEGSSVNFYALMRLASGGQTKSLRNSLVTLLANDKEAELERIYNNQQTLPLEERPDGE